MIFALRKISLVTRLVCGVMFLSGCASGPHFYLQYGNEYRAHDAGHAEQVGAHGQACHAGGKPQKGAQARTGRAQQPDRIAPVNPQFHCVRPPAWFFAS